MVKSRHARVLYLLLVLPSLSGCASAAGYCLGKAVDRHTGEDGHALHYASQALEFDYLILQDLLRDDDSEWTPPSAMVRCASVNEKQVCSALRGCWCEADQRR